MRQLTHFPWSLSTAFDTLLLSKDFIFSAWGPEVELPRLYIVIAIGRERYRIRKNNIHTCTTLQLFYNLAFTQQY